jgi:hypothetical protein
VSRSPRTIPSGPEGGRRGTGQGARRVVEGIVTSLVEQIVKAHVQVGRGEPGAQERLEQLQRRYRNGGRSVMTRGGASPSSSVMRS